MQASRWVWVPAERECALRTKVRNPDPNLTSPSGGQAALDSGGGPRAPQLFLDPGRRQWLRGARGSAGVGNPYQGERAFRRQRLGAGRGPAPLGSLCGHVHPAFAGLCRFGSGDVHLRAPLCVRGFVWLFSAYVHVLWARVWLWVWVGSLSCVRVRGLCLSTCLGWMSVECVRAESQTPPNSLLPCCPPGPPT